MEEISAVAKAGAQAVILGKALCEWSRQAGGGPGAVKRFALATVACCWRSSLCGERATLDDQALHRDIAERDSSGAEVTFDAIGATPIRSSRAVTNGSTSKLQLGNGLKSTTTPRSRKYVPPAHRRQGGDSCGSALHRPRTNHGSGCTAPMPQPRAAAAPIPGWIGVWLQLLRVSKKKRAVSISVPPPASAFFGILCTAGSYDRSSGRAVVANLAGRGGAACCGNYGDPGCLE